VAEGDLSGIEKEISDHLKRFARDEEMQRDRVLTIIEAVLLAVVALLAAYSGYAAAKWATESRLDLSKASTARTQASAEQIADLQNRTLDETLFNDWYDAYTSGDTQRADLAMRRFRIPFLAAFNAWLATDPLNDPNARPDPTHMLQYAEPELDRAMELGQQADQLAEEGSRAALTGDNYVRSTVYLATVLFLVGISGHFRVFAARYGLIAVAGVILLFAIVQLITLPKPFM
jgi:hypothetical protein